MFKDGVKGSLGNCLQGFYIQGWSIVEAGNYYKEFIFNDGVLWRLGNYSQEVYIQGWSIVEDRQLLQGVYIDGCSMVEATIYKDRC